MQLNAAYAILNDSLSETRDFDLALTYANRALKIAQEHPAPQDTLLGLTCEALGLIYMGKQDLDKCLYYYEKAIDAYEIELGRFDPVTNGSKLVYGWMMVLAQPSLGFPKILEAIRDNSRAPEDKRIQNMDEANISLELALEMLIAEQTQRFAHALPVLTIDGHKYLLVQTKEWNMEHPLVGWMAMSMMPSETNKEEEKNDETILLGDDDQFTVLTEADKNKRQLQFNFRYFKQNRSLLVTNDGDARLMFLNQDDYNSILSKFRNYKTGKK